MTSTSSKIGFAKGLSFSIKIAAIYFLLGVLWILLSDKILGVLVRDQAVLTNVSIIKGWLYVSVTALMLYVLIRRGLSRIEQAGKEARLSEAKYRQLVESANSIIMRRDITGRITFFNEFAQDFFGYSKEEILGRNVIGTIVPEVERSGRDLKEMIEDIGKHPERYTNNENENMRANGERVWIAWTNKPIWDENGKIKEVLCIGNDISKRKISEEKLQQSNSFLDAIIENTPHAMWISDDNGTLIRSNHAMRDLFKIADDDVVGKYNLLQDDILEAQGYMPLIKEVFEKGKTVKFTLDYDTSLLRQLNLVQTVFVSLDVTISPILDMDGRVTNAIVQEVDITERKEAEEVLRESEQRFRSMVENSPFAYQSLDIEGCYIDVNQELCDLLGYRPDELLGRSFGEFWPENTRAIFTQVFETFKCDHEVSSEIILITKDGREISVILEGRVEQDNDGNFLRTNCILTDITQRKQAENELSAQRDTLAKIFESAPYIMMLVTKDGRVTNINHKGVAFAGKPKDELLGLLSGEVFSCFNSLDGPGCGRTAECGNCPVRTRVIQTFETGQGNYDAKGRMTVRKNSMDIVVEMSISTALVKDKDTDLVLVTIADITERARQAREIVHLNRLYSVLGRVSQAVVRATSPETFLEQACREIVEGGGFLLAWIGRVELMTNTVVPTAFWGEIGAYLQGITVYSDNLPEGRGPTGVCIRESRPSVHNDFLNAPQTLPWRDRAAPFGIASCAAFPIEREGRMWGALSIYSDEVDRFSDEDVKLLEKVAGDIDFALDNLDREFRRRQAEEALRLHAERVQALLNLNQMTDATPQEITDYALEGAVRLTQSKIGYMAFLNDDETILTMHSWSKQAMDECAIIHKPVDFNVRETGLWGEAVRQRRVVITNDYAAPNPLKKGYPAGHVALQRHMGVPVFVGPHIVLVAGVGNKNGDYDENDAQQLTLLMEGMWRLIERKRGEEERKKLEGQLFQAQKMESVGRLAGGVAHDFNNMLGVIIGRAEMALEQNISIDKLHESLREILKAGLRSADLTRQLLAFARKQTAIPKVLDLNDTISGILKMLRRLIGEDIDLLWAPELDLWKVKIDPSQVDQILANLVVNARDAISGVGAITLRTDNVAISDSLQADHLEFIPGDYVQLTVSDTGEGMSKEVRDNIFEPFFTTKEPGKGTGLGLSTVYGIVKQNDGFIQVASEPGKGTTFQIYLPRFEAKTAQVPFKEITVKRPTGTETILLVEDDEAILNLSMIILESLGYTVLAAHTPVYALHLVEEHTGDLHLLITDVVMPEMNGRALVEELRGSRSNLKCLYMSGYTADVITHRGLLDDGVNFIQKPFGADDFAAKVREVLDHRE
jgi:PAS domain S-box-containing protein